MSIELAIKTAVVMGGLEILSNKVKFFESLAEIAPELVKERELVQRVYNAYFPVYFTKIIYSNIADRAALVSELRAKSSEVRDSKEVDEVIRFFLPLLNEREADLSREHDNFIKNKSQTPKVSIRKNQIKFESADTKVDPNESGYSSAVHSSVSAIVSEPVSNRINKANTPVAEVKQEDIGNIITFSLADHSKIDGHQVWIAVKITNKSKDKTIRRVDFTTNCLDDRGMLLGFAICKYDRAIKPESGSDEDIGWSVNLSSYNNWNGYSITNVCIGYNDGTKLDLKKFDMVYE